MILDSSAVVAVLTEEADGPVFRELIYDAPVTRLSAATYLELGIVLDGKDLGNELDRFLDWCEAEVEPVTAHQARLARVAHRQFGRGSGHPARLNFGDCFAYALAMDKREPLLFKGDDFSRTDVLVTS